ncbi:MAG: hypothetical protein KAG98_06730, partial [Lentisphaeria bacterium]|nr:hypothetical protein [Lentisphaeria bacterium]
GFNHTMYGACNSPDGKEVTLDYVVKDIANADVTDFIFPVGQPYEVYLKADGEILVGSKKVIDTSSAGNDFKTGFTLVYDNKPGPYCEIKLDDERFTYSVVEITGLHATLGDGSVEKGETVSVEKGEYVTFKALETTCGNPSSTGLINWYKEGNWVGLGEKFIPNTNETGAFSFNAKYMGMAPGSTMVLIVGKIPAVTFTATASGKRTVSAGQTLVCADDGSARSINFKVETEGDFQNNYPQWNTITGTKGEASTTVSITSDTTATVDISAAQSKDIDIDFQDNLKGTFSIDLRKEGITKDIMDKVESFLALFGEESGLSVEGDKVSLSYEKVDKYNDGLSLGWKYTATGYATASLDEFSFSFPPADSLLYPKGYPLGASGTFFRATGSFGKLTVSIAGSGTYDASQASPGSGNIELSGSVSSSLSANLNLFAVLDLTVTGSTSISASLKLEPDNDAIFLKGKVGVDPLAVKVSVKARVTENLEWELYTSKEYKIIDGDSKVFSKQII